MLSSFESIVNVGNIPKTKEKKNKNRENILAFTSHISFQFCVYIFNGNWQWLEKWTRKTTSSWFYIWRKVFSCCRWFLSFFYALGCMVHLIIREFNIDWAVGLLMHCKIYKSKPFWREQRSEYWNMWSPLFHAIFQLKYVCSNQIRTWTFIRLFNALSLCFIEEGRTNSDIVHIDWFPQMNMFLSG